MGARAQRKGEGGSDPQQPVEPLLGPRPQSCCSRAFPPRPGLRAQPPWLRVSGRGPCAPHPPRGALSPGKPPTVPTLPHPGLCSQPRGSAGTSGAQYPGRRVWGLRDRVGARAGGAWGARGCCSPPAPRGSSKGPEPQAPVSQRPEGTCPTGARGAARSSRLGTPASSHTPALLVCQRFRGHSGGQRGAAAPRGAQAGGRELHMGWGGPGATMGTKGSWVQGQAPREESRAQGGQRVPGRGAGHRGQGGPRKGGHRGPAAPGTGSPRQGRSERETNHRGP